MQSKLTVHVLITEMEILAAAACRETEGSGVMSSESDSESAADDSRVVELSSGVVHSDVKHGGSTGGFFITGVWNLISCDTQLINGL